MPAQRIVPTREQLADLHVLNNAEAGLKYGHDSATIARWRREHGIPNVGKVPRPAPPPEPEPEITTRTAWDIPPDVDIDAGIWSTLETLQRQIAKLDNAKEEVSVTLPDDGPALIVFSSDWHLGHIEADMTRLRADLTLIRDTPGMYAILGGDLIDNVVTSVASRGMHHQQLAPVRVQKQLAEDAVEYVGREKVLAMLLGNHDAWSISGDDFDPIGYLAKHVGCPYLGAFGFVNVELGRCTYRLLAAHQFRMRSSFNKTHQAKRLLDFTGEADAVFTGHTHDSAAESTHIRRRRCFLGQAGSYLKSSRYSAGLGFAPATPEMPGVLLFPRERRFIGVYDAFREGVEMLKFWREGRAAA